eukprot:1076963-Ditylum_brightwellii.AAC.1
MPDKASAANTIEMNPSSLATMKKGRGVIIPAKNLNDFMSRKAQFPCDIKASSSSTEQKTITIHHLEEKDLDSVVQM